MVRVGFRHTRCQRKGGDRVLGKGSGPPRWAQEMGGFSSGNERQSPSQRAKAPLRARKPRPNKNTRKPFIFQRTS